MTSADRPHRDGERPVRPTEQPLHDLVVRSQRLGADPSLVVYGGGNTSAKGEIVDHLGRRRRVMWVKGSGADLKDAGEDDYPALRLDELLPLREYDELDDDRMVDLVTRALVDPASRRPSIETLLHAFLPYTHIDHVHADSICALTNHKAGPEMVAEALGEGFAYVDWLRPGFTLSKIVGDLEHFEGVVLAHHGLVTWADDTGECLRRTLDAVRAADTFLDARIGDPGTTGRTAGPAHDDIPADELDRLLTHLRGTLSRTGRRILRVDQRLRHIADRPDVATVVAGGVASGDHMLRIKPYSAVVTDPADPQHARAEVEAYAHRYEEYVDRHRELLPDNTRPHDPMPRVLLVPGVGAVTTGKDRRDAEVAADIALHTHTVAATVTDAFGQPEPLTERETFRFDYWPMELYKLALKPAPPPLAGMVFVITGAASGIGRGIAEHLAGLHASLVLADVDSAGLDAVAQTIAEAGGAEPVTVPGDQADPSTSAATVAAGVRAFGGLDGVVFNAGIGVSGRLDELSLEDWERGQRVNATSAFLLTQQAMRVLREQGSGGSLVYVASKNALSPGAGFGAYSVSKAAMVQLMRIAALEGGADGIRANAVNPDAVFDNSKLWDGGLREQRASAHGIGPDELEDFYAGRNLLHRQVRTADVAATVAFLLGADSSRTTGALIPVDGGVAAAFPR